MGIPQGKGRPRFSRAGTRVRAYTPEKTVAYESLVKQSYEKSCRGILLSGPIKATITAYFPVPKRTSKKIGVRMIDKEIKHTKKPDVDNIIKSVLDSLNGIAYDDDKQVFEIHAVKYYGLVPRVHVVLKEISE